MHSSQQVGGDRRCQQQHPSTGRFSFDDAHCELGPLQSRGENLSCRVDKAIISRGGAMLTDDKSFA